MKMEPPDYLDQLAELALPPDSSEGVSLDDFNAYMPSHSYIFTPSREMWPAASVNARISPVSLFDKSGQPALDKDGKQKTMPASMWLDKNKSVEQMTWAPGEPMLISQSPDFGRRMDRNTCASIPCSIVAAS